MESSDWSHETVLAPVPVSALKARRFVCAHLAEHRLRYLMDPVRLVASELATNAILTSPTPFRLTLSRSEGTVLLTLLGPTVPRPRRSGPPAPALGGHGLAVVELLSREWGVDADEEGRSRVWVAFATRTVRV